MTYVIGEAPGPQGTVMVRSVRRISEISGIPESDLRRVFVFTNLLDVWPGHAPDGGSRFPLEKAKLRAAMLVDSLPDDERLILLGRRVQSAFLGNRQQAWFEWVNDLAVVPHPSGISKLWGDPAIVARAATFWREAYAQERSLVK